jgi:hypothetical protein
MGKVGGNISNFFMSYGPEHFNSVLQHVLFPHFLQRKEFGSITSNNKSCRGMNCAYSRYHRDQ